ncbi:MAG: hypothetical protein QGG74_04115 [Phycisphaerales bacterium]|nr:hypothetical protein [Phycisphaerales bacterium]
MRLDTVLSGSEFHDCITGDADVVQQREGLTLHREARGSFESTL